MNYSFNKRWEWRITAWYAPDVMPPKSPLGLAMQTIHVDDHSKDIELAIFLAREDIGDIFVEKLHTDNYPYHWKEAARFGRARRDPYAGVLDHTGDLGQ